jgi:hypothetical protein
VSWPMLRLLRGGVLLLQKSSKLLRSFVYAEVCCSQLEQFVREPPRFTFEVQHDLVVIEALIRGFVSMSLSRSVV